MNKVLALLLIAFSVQAQSATIDARTSQRLEQILASDHRAPENRLRDQYRHPAETLAFFGITDTQTVVEIFPGGGWYTEILAPLLKPHGKLYEANYSDTSPNSTPYQVRGTTSFKKKLAAHPALYNAVTVTALQIPDATTIAPAGSVDLILTFRNVHNWLKDGSADQILSTFYKTLKPGGVLGLVEHRAKPGTTLEQTIKSGYVTESEVIRLAEKAGFHLAAKSEINANPKDSKDYPDGVWTLPPSLSGNPAERERYLAIGESDRMTLKFYKP
ncbi:MAG: methyltransferase [Herminiimonas sp.]|uniref:class I SAM-dependent methyltransferase n=1 Tax=Herminiimonas sp. TaxID=1926289 RepID=UPI00271D379F|nr:methyltransferase [Herminiimonas sp.]MDO9422219.1 methyltransferase [Herminiimonas sp.]